MDFLYDWTIGLVVKMYNAPDIVTAAAIYAEFMVLMILRLLIWFFALMAIYHAVLKKGKTSWQFKIAERILMPLGGRFIAMDILGNYHITPILLQFPKKWNETISERHGRYLKYIGPQYQSSGPLDRWRYQWAKFWCQIINAVDPGHCIRYAP